MRKVMPDLNLFEQSLNCGSADKSHATIAHILGQLGFEHFTYGVQ